MKNYKNYTKQYIGGSDIALLTAVGPGEEEMQSVFIRYGGDGEYSAYIVDEDAEIGDHYKKIATFNHWLKIYDDDSKTLDINADKIEIFRAAERGTVVKTTGRR